MQTGWWLGLLVLSGCSLPGAQKQGDFFSAVVPPERPAPYAFICLDG